MKTQFEFGMPDAFNLAGESAQDGARPTRELEAKRIAAAEAKEIEARRQITLLDWEDTAKQYEAV